jgi:imidazolonepropionase-like amidohydrolase
VPADEMGYGAELGRVVEGMVADLVVLGGDPLADIGAVRDTRIVVADGRVYEVDELLRRPIG